VSGLDVLGEHEGFSLHPLMTVTRAGANFAGVFAAVSGATPRATAVATALAATIGLRPVQVAEADRGAYHAAAAFAANYLVTLESAAAELMSTVGLQREVLLPLARAALENWGRQGPSALTGPIARGDRQTVERHRAVVADRTPDLLPLFEALTTATERLVANLAVPAGAGSDGAGSDRAVPDGAAPDGAAPDRVGSDRAVSDRAVSDRAVSDRAVSDTAAAVEIVSPGPGTAPQTTEWTRS
jgi:hypothetical protein